MDLRNLQSQRESQCQNACMMELRMLRQVLNARDGRALGLGQPLFQGIRTTSLCDVNNSLSCKANRLLQLGISLSGNTKRSPDATR